MRRGTSGDNALRSTTIEGIVTRYELIGEGPPLLMCSPGGLDGVPPGRRVRSCPSRNGAEHGALLARDTAPGAEPEDLMRLDIPALIVPGRDASHATSAARYMEECLPRAEYWDVPPDAQTEDTAPPRVLEFLRHAA